MSSLSSASSSTTMPAAAHVRHLQLRALMMFARRERDGRIAPLARRTRGQPRDLGRMRRGDDGLMARHQRLQRLHQLFVARRLGEIGEPDDQAAMAQQPAHLDRGGHRIGFAAFALAGSRAGGAAARRRASRAPACSRSACDPRTPAIRRGLRSRRRVRPASRPRWRTGRADRARRRARGCRGRHRSPAGFPGAGLRCIRARSACRGAPWLSSRCATARRRSRSRAAAAAPRRHPAAAAAFHRRIRRAPAARRAAGCRAPRVNARILLQVARPPGEREPA